MANWTAVAKKYSNDPTTKNTGGLLTNVTKGQQDAALSTAAFAAPKKQADRSGQGPVRLLHHRRPEGDAGGHQDAGRSRRADQADAHQPAQTTAADAVTDLAKKDWQSKTKCRSLYAMADCSGYKAPKTVHGQQQDRRPLGWPTAVEDAAEAGS